MTYSSDIIALSPYSYHRLGDTSGLTAADSSGNGRNGTYVGTPGLNTAGLLIGDANPAVTFSAGNYMTVTDDNGLDGLGGISIVALINANSISSTTVNQIAARDGGSSNRSFQFRVDTTGKLSFVKIPSATATATGSTTLGLHTTYHVAATYDGANIRVYVNGVQDGIVSATGTLGTVAQDLYISRRFGDGTFDGILDEVAVFTTALSAPTISALYTSSTNGTGTLTQLTGAWGLAS